MISRTSWTGIDKKTRDYVLKRDKRCLICGSRNNLTLAHVFVSRAKGGKGCKENLAVLCSRCHYYIVDNPIGKKNNELSKKYKERLKIYLKIKENVTDDMIKDFIYRK